MDKSNSNVKPMQFVGRNHVDFVAVYLLIGNQPVKTRTTRQLKLSAVEVSF